MTAPKPDLDALEAAHAKATQKRWTGGYEAIHTQTDRNHPWASTVFSANHDGAEADALLTMTFGKTPEHATANAAAIVALHNAFPALLAYTRALEARVDELEACAQNCAGQFDSYVDAHNAKGPDGHVKALKNAVWRDYAMSVLDGNAKPTPESAKIVALEAEVAALRGALRLFTGAAYPVAQSINQRGHNWCEAYLDDALRNARQFDGCDVCGGDCSAANPPVINCPRAAAGAA